MSQKEPEKKSSMDQDIELSRRNLELSYEERLEEHQRALDLVIELEAAGRGYYDKQSQQSSEDSTRK